MKVSTVKLWLQDVCTAHRTTSKTCSGSRVYFRADPVSPLRTSFPAFVLVAFYNPLASVCAMNLLPLCIFYEEAKHKVTRVALQHVPNAPVVKEHVGERARHGAGRRCW